MIGSILRAGLVTAMVLAAAGGYATTAAVTAPSSVVVLAQTPNQQCLLGCADVHATCKTSCAGGPSGRLAECNRLCDAANTICIDKCNNPVG